MHKHEDDLGLFETHACIRLGFLFINGYHEAIYYEGRIR